ncbi:MAG: hypothetical protein ACR5K4_01770 [Sodalis sp. (in: enterobacteria)]
MCCSSRGVIINGVVRFIKMMGFLEYQQKLAVFSGATRCYVGIKPEELMVGVNPLVGDCRRASSTMQLADYLN